MKRYAFILLLLATPVLGTQVKLPQPPTPAPVPTPPPAPVSVAQLNSDQWYVFDSDVKCLLLGSPDGLLKFTEDAGPVTMKGKFVFGTGVEKRTFSKKFVYTVEAAGTGQCELIVVPLGVTALNDIARQMLAVNQAPRPPDPPIPPVDPFQATLQAAYNLDTDTDKAASVADMARVYKAAAALIPGTGFTSLNGVTKWINDSFQIKATAVPNTIKAIGVELNKVLPVPSDAPLDQATKDLLAAQFARIGNALGTLRVGK